MCVCLSFLRVHSCPLTWNLPKGPFQLTTIFQKLSVRLHVNGREDTCVGVVFKETNFRIRNPCLTHASSHVWLHPIWLLPDSSSTPSGRGHSNQAALAEAPALPRTCIPRSSSDPTSDPRNAGCHGLGMCQVGICMPKQAFLLAAYRGEMGNCPFCDTEVNHTWSHQRLLLASHKRSRV